MVRKAKSPRRLDDDERKEASWNSADPPGPLVHLTEDSPLVNIADSPESNDEPRVLVVDEESSSSVEIIHEGSPVDLTQASSSTIPPSSPLFLSIADTPEHRKERRTQKSAKPKNIIPVDLLVADTSAHNEEPALDESSLLQFSVSADEDNYSFTTANVPSKTHFPVFPSSEGIKITPMGKGKAVGVFRKLTLMPAEALPFTALDSHMRCPGSSAFLRPFTNEALGSESLDSPEELHDLANRILSPISWYLMLEEKKGKRKRRSATEVKMEGDTAFQLNFYFHTEAATSSVAPSALVFLHPSPGEQCELWICLTQAAVMTEPLVGHSNLTRPRRALPHLLHLLGPPLHFPQDDTDGALEALRQPPLYKSRQPLLGRENIGAFYKALKERHEESAGDKEGDDWVGHADLVPTLRPYQKAAVQWMIQREEDREDDFDWSQFFAPFQLENMDGSPGLSLHYCPRAGSLVRECGRGPGPRGTGGILADEMGLGKTVEVITLVLLTQPPSLPLLGSYSEECSSAVIPGYMTEVKEEEADDEWMTMYRAQRPFMMLEGHHAPDGRLWTADRVRLECHCGDESIASPLVRCNKCEKTQHLDCTKPDPVRARRRYLCPYCSASEPPVQGRATLIVSPSSIARQWEEEIGRHTRPGSLRLIIYPGVRHSYLDPQVLGAADMVVVTYETLRAELNYVEAASAGSRALRGRKRYRMPPSPLMGVHWWRVCLDEAQMVEDGSSKAALMCHRLHSTHRWAVTGTPIQSSVKDLYGLLVFLRAGLWSWKLWWEKGLWEAYRFGDDPGPLLAVLSPVFWRTEKAAVRHQLGLPPQSEKLHWVQFSPVEEHFYRRCLEHSAANARLGIMRCRPDDVSEEDWLANKLDTLDRGTIDRIMGTFHYLRHACSYPNLSTTERGRQVPMGRKTTLTMGAVLAKMMEETKTEAEAEQRLLLSAHNGKAALYWLQGSMGDAAESYREVLRAAASKEVDSDLLQQLHALHNLRLLLENVDPGVVPPTLRDDALATDEDKCRDKYLTETLALHQKTLESQRAVEREVAASLKKGKEWEGWHVVAAEVLNVRQLEPTLIFRVRTRLQQTQNHSFGFNTMKGLSLVVSRAWDELEAYRAKAVEMMRKIKRMSVGEAALVELPSICHLRPVLNNEAPARTCILCKAEKLIINYESKLFNGKHEAGEDEEDKKEINWTDSALGLTLKCLVQFCIKELKDASESSWMLAGKAHLEALELMKKEFKATRKLWMSFCEMSGRRDELAMATQRLRLRTQQERDCGAEAEVGVVESVAGIPALLADNDAEAAAARRNLAARLGQLAYLRNLQSIQDQRAQGGNENNAEPCPICKNELGQKWAVLSCGHCLCLDCVQILAQRALGHRVDCAYCRQKTDKETISYVILKALAEDEDEGLPEIRGSYSSKVDAMIRQLHRIQRDDATVKVLIFSSWAFFLSHLSLALAENKLEHGSLVDCGGKRADIIHAFRTDPAIKVLLMPMSSGSKGLNLVEANHVFLAEPLLNPAVEAQAVGRVDRIGQVRDTFIHRFLLKGSVEEKIWEATRYILYPPLSLVGLLAIWGLRRGGEEESRVESGRHFTLGQLLGMLS